MASQQQTYEEAKELMKKGVLHEHNCKRIAAQKYFRRILLDYNDFVSLKIECTVEFYKNFAVDDKANKKLVASIKEKTEKFQDRFQKNDENPCYIDKLPNEVIRVLIDKIVGSTLDLASLERIGLVSSNFFLFTRDEVLWKDIYKRSTNIAANENDGLSWRTRFFRTPHLLFDGFYLSKKLRDESEEPRSAPLVDRPDIIEGYDMIKFYPDGTSKQLAGQSDPMRSYHLFEGVQALCGTWKIEKNHVKISRKYSMFDDRRQKIGESELLWDMKIVPQKNATFGLRYLSWNLHSSYYYIAPSLRELNYTDRVKQPDFAFVPTPRQND
ncbi:unnamed protein product [Caenorhabditis bovis]|uniref:F-box domain-containing protein n=1 Tax=Caenorhabditis bovis TaxID=2654633 RepID=A0A8S1FD06_9PELO|nr:unnamed protein product [Caenorhabditis bovis]